MIINTNDKLTFFKELYEEARGYCDTNNELLDKYYRQYKGSEEIDGSDTPAKHVRNITYELIESQITSYLPTPIVTPKMYNEKNERNAKSIETLLRNKRDELPFEEENDMDERYNPIYGGSVWLVEWDNSVITHNAVGDVRIKCISPKHFVGQPNIYSIDDMEYCFISFETTKEDIVRQYNISPELLDATQSDEGADDKTATLYCCYYKNEENKVCEYVWSGETELLDIDDYFARKRYVCATCGKRKELCSCEKPKLILQSEEYEELDRDIVTSHGMIPARSEMIRDGQIVYETTRRQAVLEDGSLGFAPDDESGMLLPILEDVQIPKTEPTRLPFYLPDALPIVIRKNTSQENSLLGQSDCEFIRPLQQAINKVESRILEKLMKSSVFPTIPEDSDITLDNSVFGQVIRLKQGQQGLYGILDLQSNISQDIAEAERLYDHAKRILGITDSFQGQYDGSAQSGKAKQLQIQQAAGRLDSKRQMKNSAYARIDKIIFQYYLAYADEPRPAMVIDALGNRQNIMFNRYDFIERDESGEWYYNDEYLFSTDSTIDIERSRETLWQENLANLKSGTYGDPSDPLTLLRYWQILERTHYPFARENVEYFKEIVARREQEAAAQQQIADMGEELANHENYETYLLKKIQERGLEK